MQIIKDYILSLVGFGFVSSLACAVLPDVSAKKTVKFICGIIMSLLILTPLLKTQLDFSDILPMPQSYNVYSVDKVKELTQSVIADKVSETVESYFKVNGITDVKTEVVFDSDGNIKSINIDAVNEQAARDAAAALGVPYEIIHMTG
ncbi:MAG: stage III sporulation protein AF [Monoglobales bacterium]